MSVSPVATPAFTAIGTPGRPWGDAERAQWRSRLERRRVYAETVLPRVERLRATWDVLRYGEVAYDGETFPLFALRSRETDPALPIALVTGGVHGYETSGVHGALEFAEHHAGEHAGRIQRIVVPCVSPWAFERVQRWNRDAVDPNRSFRPGSPSAEAAALIDWLGPVRHRVRVHIDLHETTDSDETEFRPALAARDGVEFVPGAIPDGFYLVGDTARPQPGFQQAILEAVAQVAHIAPSDADGTLIGTPATAPGLIEYPVHELGLCVGFSDAPFVTTTEVYPDSPRTTPAECDAAQVAAVRAAIGFALAAR
ncbi:M14 family metallopeptidase [Luteimonas deserti]|uniref:M14 family metallocarboxypeptidase n=1 Tax=Luteimonas deserti TaxID=2752306 RepID=A0A7Z0QTP1_9GAMM|nr:M14 family metallocarboxypeptidase [Luteimonas deserti]NYZ63273.1 M14 family metallocarboxypeptidase [Luteimonas deserti]